MLNDQPTLVRLGEAAVSCREVDAHAGLSPGEAACSPRDARLRVKLDRVKMPPQCQDVQVDLVVSDAPDRSRFEGNLGTGELAATLTYTVAGDLYFLNHTIVEPGYEGDGVGTAMIRGTLDDVRRRNLQIIPRCPFVVAFLEKYPEYGDLVSHRM